MKSIPTQLKFGAVNHKTFRFLGLKYFMVRVIMKKAAVEGNHFG